MNVKQKMLKILDIDKLPDDVVISTMTLVCKINNTFNIPNIAKYLTITNKIITATEVQKAVLRRKINVRAKSNPSEITVIL